MPDTSLCPAALRTTPPCRQTGSRIGAKVAGHGFDAAAVVQLHNMAIGMCQPQLLLGLRDVVEEREMTGRLEHVVDDFLTLYGVSADGAD